jgi:hypothetical protein
MAYLAYIGMAIQAASKYQQGKSAKKQAFVQAGQIRATGERDAELKRKQARLLSSRGLAVAAASGAGASDPTVVNQLADIEAQGEYNALGTLYESEDAARDLEYSGKLADAEGRAGAFGSLLQAGGSAYANTLTTGSSLRHKYGT